MKNIRIEGGVDTGAPKDWDPEKRGECLTISVLHQQPEPGLHQMTTAWELSPADIRTAMREGAHLWLTILGRTLPVPYAAHPVIQIAMYDGHGQPAPEHEPDNSYMLRDAPLLTARQLLRGLIDAVDGISVAPHGVDFWQGDEMVGGLDWPDASAALVKLIAASNPADIVEAVADHVAAALGMDVDQEAIADAWAYANEEVPVPEVEPPEPDRDAGVRLQAAVDAAEAELERQAETRENAPDIGEIDDAGQIWLRGTFDLKAVVEAAVEAADKLRPGPTYAALRVSDADLSPDAARRFHGLPALGEVVGYCGSNTLHERAEPYPVAFEEATKQTDTVEIPIMTLDAVAAEEHMRAVVARAEARTIVSRRGIEIGAFEQLSLWVICENPSDIPGKFTARLHIVGGADPGPTMEHHEGDTLDQVRALLPAGLTRLERHPSDDPVIVESWI